MKTLLQSKHSRRIFLLAVSCIILLILFTRFFVLPSCAPSVPPSGVIPKEPIWMTITSRILDSTFISLTVTIGIGLFLFYIELPEDEKKFEILESFKLKELFEKERNNTEIWYFTGGLGRYTRLATIPKIAQIAQKNNQHKSIKIQLIDPGNEEVCANYANFRRSLHSATENDVVWSKDYVRKECIATIVSAIIHKCNYPLLDLSIYLKNNFSTLRIDLSSKAAIVTKEDTKEPALISREGSFLYRTYKEEMLQTFKEYKLLNTSEHFPYMLSTLTKEQIQEVVRKIGLESNLSDDDYAEISEIIKSTDNPYE